MSWNIAGRSGRHTSHSVSDPSRRTRNTNSASGTFNQINGHQYNGPVTMILGDGDTARVDASGGSEVMRRLRARKRALQTENDTLLDNMSWEEAQQRLQQEVADLEKTRQIYRASTTGVGETTNEKGREGGKKTRRGRRKSGRRGPY